MKSKNTASFLALFLGGIGIHRFYLGQTAKGIFSLIFFWTYIPLLISIIDFIVFITMSEEKFNIKYNQLITNVNSNHKKEKAMLEKAVQNPVKSTKVPVTTSVFLNNYDDHSIIDITNQAYAIPPTSNLKYNVDVPKWKHQYVYSYSEINAASSEQKFFYSIFKDKFFKEIFIDVDGNTNYAFILLFDLLNEYDNHKDITKLEKQFKYLGLHYPKTKSYCSSFLMKKTSTIDFVFNAGEIKPHLNKSSNSESINHITLKKEKEIQNELIVCIIESLKKNEASTDLQTNLYDESIIDITNEHYSIKEENVLEEEVKVPNWKHQYVYSFSEINHASNEQKQFYYIFKNNFFNDKYVDLEGNTNYAFVLLFDLLNEYENHKDIYKLESQTNTLGQCYPQTKSYAISFLKQKAKNANFSTLKKENVYSYEEYWKLGNKHKDKLKLNEEDVKLLNTIYTPSNNFFNIEYCGLEIIKLYIAVISALKGKYIQEETTIDKEFLAVADVIARKQFRYRNGSQNYKYCIETTPNEFYSHIFKCCENAVREFYGHKRKLNTDSYYTNIEAKTEFETKILSKVTELFPILITNVSQPNENTDIELYALNTSRWKIKFERLTTNYNNKPQEFIDSIISLGKLNKKNPSVENIFFEASKFIAKYDKEFALSLYIHYLYQDLKSATFDNKQHTKTIQKSLFKTNEQLHDFERIVSELIKDKDLEKALKQIPEIYKIKRKKIQLNRASINEVIEQHSETVELLNEYLKDDFEDENSTIKSQEISNEEIQIEIIQKSEDVHQSAFVSELTFTEIHTTALELFAKSNFLVSQSEFEVFAKSKGVFKNQLIESINDTCYEFLDDVLIEEEDDCYIINTNYFQRISTK